MLAADSIIGPKVGGDERLVGLDHSGKPDALQRLNVLLPGDRGRGRNRKALEGGAIGGE